MRLLLPPFFCPLFPCQNISIMNYQHQEAIRWLTEILRHQPTASGNYKKILRKRLHSIKLIIWYGCSCFCKKFIKHNYYTKISVYVGQVIITQCHYTLLPITWKCLGKPLSLMASFNFWYLGEGRKEEGGPGIRTDDLMIRGEITLVLHVSILYCVCSFDQQL